MSKLIACIVVCLAGFAGAGTAAAHSAGASHTARTAHARAARTPHARRSARRRRAVSVACTRRRRALAREHRLHGRLVRCSTRVKHRRRLATAASATSAVTGAVRAHIETWAYDDCGNGGGTASSGLVRSWLTYAETNCGPNGTSKALADCHSSGGSYCNVIQYLDTNWIYQTGSPPWDAFRAAAPESWYQHVAGSSTDRIRSSAYGGGYLINQTLGAVRSFFRGYVRANYDALDGLMMDDQSTGLGTQLYYSGCGCHATDEVPGDAALRAAHGAMSAAMTHSDGRPFVQIDNSLPSNPYLPQGFDMLNQTTGVVGLVKEGSPEYNGTLDPYYSTLLDEIAYAANKTSGFVVPLSYGQAGASYQARERRVQEATILLGYSSGHLVDWADLESDSNHLAVWPEEGIYPTAPVQSMGAPNGTGCLTGDGSPCTSGGHNDVQVAPGVYRREFGACYDQGRPFGACATIVNTTHAAVTVKATWLSRSYGHVIGFQGGDVQSGGTIDTAGAGFSPGATTVPAQDALLLS